MLRRAAQTQPMVLLSPKAAGTGKKCIATFLSRWPFLSLTRSNVSVECEWRVPGSESFRFLLCCCFVCKVLCTRESCVSRNGCV